MIAPLGLNAALLVLNAVLGLLIVGLAWEMHRSPLPVRAFDWAGLIVLSALFGGGVLLTLTGTT